MICNKKFILQPFAFIRNKTLYANSSYELQLPFQSNKNFDILKYCHGINRTLKFNSFFYWLFSRRFLFLFCSAHVPFEWIIIYYYAFANECCVSLCFVASLKKFFCLF